MGRKTVLGVKVKPVLVSWMLTFDKNGWLLLDFILMPCEYVPAVITIGLPLLKVI
jgi:hypothetical protein